MNRPRPRRLLLLGALLPLALAAVPATASAANLYVQQAAGGSLSGDTLVLRGVSPRTTSFTDRPQRSTSTLSTRSFVASWATAFGDDPPNAALEIAGAPVGRDVAILTLRAPRYDARRRTLTFRVTRVREAGGALAPLDRRADARVPSRFGRAALFIDDGGAGGAQVLVTLSAPDGLGVELAFTDGSGLEIGQSAPYTASVTPLNQTGPQVVIAQNAVLVQGSVGPGSALIQAWATSPNGTLTGNASVPAGGSASIAVGGGDAIPIPAGPFSIPLG